MKIEYDKFLRLGGENGPALPQVYPYSITMLMEDGTFKEEKITSRYKLDLRNAISVKIHRPDPVALLMDKVRKDTGVSVATLTEVFHSLEKHKALQLTVNPDRDWLDAKMDELGIRYENVRKGIRNWFEDPERYKEVNYDLKNQILTVRHVAGGRVVALPVGHTIAYSKAREIYREMLTGYSEYNPPWVLVGEYSYGNIAHREYALRIEHRGVTVGCQFVPRQAILDLAKRERWN